MEVTLTVHDVDGTRRDVVVSGPSGSTLAQVCAPLSRVRPVDTWWSKSRALPLTAVIGGPGLRSGDEVSATGPSNPAGRSGLALEIVCGRWAGRSFPLLAGTNSVGRSIDCAVVLPDPRVSREHLRLAVGPDGVRVYDSVSTNGTLVDGSPIPAVGTPLDGGEVIRIGDTTVSLAKGHHPPAALRPAIDGRRQVNRPPRLDGDATADVIVYPERLGNHRPLRTSLLAAVVPALAGGGFAIASGNLAFLAFAALGPLALLITVAVERRTTQRLLRRGDRDYRADLELADAVLGAALTGERARRRAAHPDPAAVVRTATAPDSRLWERRPGDSDFLDVRVGSGDLPSYVTVRRDDRETAAGVVRAVPLAVGLAGGALGLAAARPVATELASWAVLQLAVQHSPNDVGIELLLSDSTIDSWRWTRWLPHLRQPPPTDAESRLEAVRHLCALVERRLAQQHRSSVGGWEGRWLVVVIDRCANLTELPGLAAALAGGSAVGVTAICVDDDRRRLLASCAAVVETVGGSGPIARVDGVDLGHVEDVLVDLVEPQTIEDAARALASLVDSASESGDVIPRSCGLVSTLGLVEPGLDDLQALWAAGPVTTVALGSSAHGRYELDLAADGPHALIAGTTGSGKSELLRSLVVGLACRNSPAALAFVLIDYKGGAAFAECSRLPHTAGLVTDLDAGLTERALTSLDAELRRRETILSAAGQPDFDAYLSMTESHERKFGRLVLVVDEFAALVDEFPDFIDGLVGVAQRGRSLGIHLVLATQRPAGVVSPEIKANTTIRVALRVTDPTESVDVIGTKNAAEIDGSDPGRAFVRIGAGLTEVQTAYGGRRRAGRPEAAVIEVDGWARPTSMPDDPTSVTELESLCDQLRTVAQRTAVEPPWCPWLPPLPDRIRLDELVAAEPSGAAELGIGLVDLPAQQRQTRFTLDLSHADPLLIAGSSGSGRTNALLAIAAAAVRSRPPGRLHVHAIDAAGGGLRPLAELEHVGTWLNADEPALLDRFMARLAAEIRRRQERAHADGSERSRPPAILVLLDGWEGCAGAFDALSALPDQLALVLREGSGVGIAVVIAGDRAVLTSRLTTTIRDRLILRLADRGDYSLAGVSPRNVPATVPPGRAIRAVDGTFVQLAIAPTPLNDPIPLTASARPQTADPRSAATDPPDESERIIVRPLPTSIRFDDVRRDLPSARSDRRPASSPDRDDPSMLTGPIVLGVGGDSAGTVRVSLAADTRLLVAGPSRSGRTTALELIALQLIEFGAPVAIAARASSRLAGLRDRPGVVCLDPHTTRIPEATVLLVDDCETFVDTELGDGLARVARSAGSAGPAVVGSVRSDDPVAAYRGLAGELRRARTGLLLQPSVGGGELFGLRRSPRSSSTIPGRGLFIGPNSSGIDDDVISLQVAQP